MKIAVKSRIQFFALFLVFGELGRISWAQEANSKPQKWVWEIIGDEVSRLLPSGVGAIEDDFNLDNQGHTLARNPLSKRRNGDATASITHVTLFSPTYVLATLIQASLLPATLVSNSLGESSAENKEAKERDELEKRLDQLEKQNKELLEILKSKAENWIESYDSKNKIGQMDPELKRHLEGTRVRIYKGLEGLLVYQGLTPQVAGKV